MNLNSIKITESKALAPLVQIVSLEQLSTARDMKRSVVVPGWWGGFAAPRPAAFMINLSGQILVRMFREGMYIYKKKGKL